MTPQKPSDHPVFRLVEIMARLRSPDGGCPWDLEQTFATVAPYTVEEAYEHAKLIGLGLLAAAKQAAGDLDKIEVLKVLGMVNAVPEFKEQPKVINGCSDLFVAVLGERGRHARSAVGMGSLPNQISVEIEAIMRVVG